ncbi:trypsin Inhibitor like cysteine rich domain protein [Oesophagostomum dentatum]|uniref:Trypsin Inhibitor like cysteine rich domain protein n=1 Tax=Oesophagostomum dentatum TaxID=61180 RepID=A0A0B1SQP8_OESDE|nr:trypsin Inhibitor like cysteine rich domain protein [Oesophagostomum dentatum]
MPTVEYINSKKNAKLSEPYNPCAATTCPVGYECRVKEVVVTTAPCYPIAECYDPADEAGGQKCGENESFKECASHCEPSCEQKSPICILSCAPGKCQCNEGFYRRSDGKCVTEAECDENTKGGSSYSRRR